jgi:hypothetical protein
MAPDPSDGGWKTWLVGALFSVTLLGGGTGFSMIQNRIAAEETMRVSEVAALEKLAIENRERIAANEATIRAMTSTLDVLNTKMDRLLQLHLR